MIASGCRQFIIPEIIFILSLSSILLLGLIPSIGICDVTSVPTPYYSTTATPTATPTITAMATELPLSGIEGYVRDNETGVPDVYVILAHTYYKTSRSVKTDSNGYFIFERVASGSYQLSTVAGPKSGSLNVNIPSGSVSNLEVEIPVRQRSSTYTIVAESVSTSVVATSMPTPTPTPPPSDNRLRNNIFKLLAILVAVFIGVATNLISAFTWLNDVVTSIGKKAWDVTVNILKKFTGGKLSELTSKKEKKRTWKSRLLGAGIELFVIIISALFMGLAFFIANREPFALDYIFLYIFVAFCAIVLHDMAHRVVATLYREDAEYKFWRLGTVSMFITALACGFVFCQPARTIIHKKPADTQTTDCKDPPTPEQVNELENKKRKAGVIFLAGPMVSLSISLIFLFMVPIGSLLKMTFTLPSVDFHGLDVYFSNLAVTGFIICLLTGVYSLMPFDPMDGSKVFRWSKIIWAACFIPSVIVYVITLFILG